MYRSTRLPSDLLVGALFHNLPEVLPHLTLAEGSKRLGARRGHPHLRSLAGVAPCHRTHREDGLRRQLTSDALLSQHRGGGHEILVITEVILQLFEYLHHPLRRLAVDPL